MYMSKEIGRMTQEDHAKVEAIADNYHYDLTNNKKFRKNFRMMMSDKDLKRMGERCLRTHIRELVDCLKEWTDVDKLRNKWSAKEGSKVKKKKTGTGTGQATVREYPLREVQAET